MPNLKSIIKLIVVVSTSASVGTVMKNIAKATTPITASPIQKVGMEVGSYILTAMVSDKAVEYVMEVLKPILGEEKNHEPVTKTETEPVDSSV